MTTLWQDLRYAIRGMMKQPGFTLIVMLTLAVGIGANTAVFSLVNGLMLKSLPYPEPDRLVMVWNDNRRVGIHQDGSSLANLADFRNQSQSFQDIGIFYPDSSSYEGSDIPVAVPIAVVSSHIFSVMNVVPVLGRAINGEEDHLGSAHVAVLSYDFWQRQVGGDADIVGKSITLSHRPLTVIGVMGPERQFPDDVEIWLNLPARFRRPDFYTNREYTLFYGIGRLRPGVSLENARAEMNVLASGLEQQFPKENTGYGVTLVPLREQVLGAIRSMLLLLSGAVTFVLLIACANIAGLLLARGAARQREISIRLALGADRKRLIRQLLTESLLLGLAGGLAGLMLAWVALRLFVAANPFNISRLDQVGVDGWALAFTLTVSLLSGLLFGLLPALQSSKPQLNAALRESSQSITISRQNHRLREFLVASQVALALILLTGAGLMIQSFRQLQVVDLGYNPERLLTFELALPTIIYSDRAKVVAFQQQLLERLSAIPGVSSAAECGSVFSTSGSMFSTEFITTAVIQIENHPLSQTGQRIEVGTDFVSPGFFQAMGIPLSKGRMFDEHDAQEAPRVVIVNDAMAKHFWPNEEPIGKRIRFNDSEEWVSVIGVVSNYRRISLEAEVGPELFTPYFPANPQVFVRTNVDPRSLPSAIRQCVWEVDKSLPIEKLQTMEQLLGNRLAPRYYSALILSLFAVIALLLAAVGIYGVLSYQVRQRSREIGIRLALGAQPRDITVLIVKRGLMLALIGLAGGLAGAFVLTKFVAGLFYGVRAFDPTNLLAVSVVLLGTTILASYIPARRAASVEPVTALRYE